MGAESRRYVVLILEYLVVPVLMMDAHFEYYYRCSRCVAIAPIYPLPVEVNSR
jgi:hypothetical protein